MGFNPNRDIGAVGTNVSLKAAYQCNFQTHTSVPRLARSVSVPADF